MRYCVLILECNLHVFAVQQPVCCVVTEAKGLAK